MEIIENIVYTESMNTLQHFSDILRQLADEYRRDGLEVGNLRDYTAAILTRAITRGLLPEHTSLMQNEIAQALNVSHIPVREALRQLETQGLVDILTEGCRIEELNCQFHLSLYAPLNNPLLTEFMEKLYINTARYLGNAFLMEEHLVYSRHEHRELLKACEEKNAVLASEIMSRHLNYVRAVSGDIFR